MANPIVLVNALVGMGGVDLSARVNKVSLDFDRTVIPITTFGDSGWNAHAAGAMSCSGSVEGLVDFGTGALDPTLFTEFGSTTATPFSFAPDRTTGQIAYLVEALQSSYVPVEMYDDAMRFSAEFSNRSRTSAATAAAARGFVIAADPDAATSSTVVSSTVEIAESTRLRMNVHIFGTSATGTVTPQIDWARVSTGTPSGTEVGTAINPGSSTVIDIAWPDAGFDLDVGVTLTAASTPVYGYLVTAAAVRTA